MLCCVAAPHQLALRRGRADEVGVAVRSGGLYCSAAVAPDAADKVTTVKLRVCDRCHTTWFCSLECLERAWPEHKPACERVVAEKKAARAEAKKKKRADGAGPSTE